MIPYNMYCAYIYTGEHLSQLQCLPVGKGAQCDCQSPTSECNKGHSALRSDPRHKASRKRLNLKRQNLVLGAVHSLCCKRRYERQYSCSAKARYIFTHVGGEPAIPSLIFPDHSPRCLPLNCINQMNTDLPSRRGTQMQKDQQKQNWELQTACTMMKRYIITAYLLC
jgi:hypothetical protein